jgi:hypothetical protein
MPQQDRDETLMPHCVDKTPHCVDETLEMKVYALQNIGAGKLNPSFEYKVQHRSLGFGTIEFLQALVTLTMELRKNSTRP